MKKAISFILSAAMILTFCSCGAKTSVPTEPVQRIETTQPSETQNQPQTSEDSLFGTWTVTNCDVDGVNYTMDELLALSPDTWSSTAAMGIVIKEGGKAIQILESGTNVLDWALSQDTFTMDNIEMQYANQTLSYRYNDSIIMNFNKTSDSQSFVDSDDTNPTETIPDEIPVEPEVMPEATPEVADDLVDGMRPEFKEAMDAYEAFYDEYCDFMVKFNDNPSDLTLVLEYTQMLSRLADMNSSFESWDEGEMNDAELKYYLEVNNRVVQKMIDAGV